MFIYANDELFNEIKDKIKKLLYKQYNKGELEGNFNLSYEYKLDPLLIKGKMEAYSEELTQDISKPNETNVLDYESIRKNLEVYLELKYRNGIYEGTINMQVDYKITNEYFVSAHNNSSDVETPDSVDSSPKPSDSLNDDMTKNYLILRREPLKVVKDNSQPRRINIVIPMLAKTLTGGPLSFFHFAYEMGKLGLKCRFLCAFENTIDRELLVKLLEENYKMPGFSKLVEYYTLEDCQKGIHCHSGDLFMGTLYSTAYTAYHSQQLLNKNPMLYFIQDYETMFFQGSTEYLEAEHTYSFPHMALFSTPFLQDYFRANRIGVYVDSVEFGDYFSLSHQPAIVCKFNELVHQNKPKKRLFVYARPMADRNAYELTIATLWMATDKGYYNKAEWEIIGIGCGHLDKDVMLAGGTKMLINRYITEDKYFELIQTGDVALSIMVSPHPSLPPFDFAASGLIVVTNSFKTKTKEKFGAISQNIIVAEPYLEDLAEKLMEAQDLSKNLEARKKGADICWAKTWNDDRCYGPTTYKKLSSLLHL